VLQRFAANDGRLECKHDAELREQATDAIDAGRALFDEALAHPVQAKPALQLKAFDGYKAHVGLLYRLADGGGIDGIALAALAPGR
jgi:hypothetical protein